MLPTLTDDVVTTSVIEGDKLSPEQVRSSLARSLGMELGALKPAERDVEGIVEVMLVATRKCDHPLTAERLFTWHAAPFPTGRNGMITITVGAWWSDNNGPMVIVFSPIGNETTTRRHPPRDWTPRCAPSSTGGTPLRTWTR